MRVCFISRRFFPAISGMSVYALNLLRQLVRDGHDVTMISQYRADAGRRRGLRRGPAAAGARGSGSSGWSRPASRPWRRGEPADFESDVGRDGRRRRGRARRAPPST